LKALLIAAGAVVAVVLIARARRPGESDPGGNLPLSRNMLGGQDRATLPIGRGLFADERHLTTSPSPFGYDYRYGPVVGKGAHGENIRHGVRTSGSSSSSSSTVAGSAPGGTNLYGSGR